MRLYDYKQQCDEWHIPYFGPTQEECDAADDYADYQYEMYAQQQLDEQTQEV